jgi:hypothetical protein
MYLDIYIFIPTIKAIQIIEEAYNCLELELYFHFIAVKSKNNNLHILKASRAS